MKELAEYSAFEQAYYGADERQPIFQRSDKEVARTPEDMIAFMRQRQEKGKN